MRVADTLIYVCTYILVCKDHILNLSYGVLLISSALFFYPCPVSCCHELSPPATCPRLQVVQAPAHSRVSTIYANVAEVLTLTSIGPLIADQAWLRIYSSIPR